MLIYCNGDSFTAGVGAADHIFPNFPGGFTDAEVKAAGRPITNFKSIKEQYYKSKFFTHDHLFGRRDTLEFFDAPAGGLVTVQGNHNVFEKQYTYSKELELLDNSIQTINAARPGASMAGIAHRTIIDLLTLKAQGKKVDLVVIQLTSFSRYEIFDCNYAQLINDRPMGNFDHDNETKISNAVLLKYTNNDLIVKYLYELSMIGETVRSITGRNPLIIDSMNGEFLQMRVTDVQDHVSIVNPSQSEWLKNLIHHSLFDTAHLMFMSNLAATLERPFAYDGHYMPNVHKLTAQELVKLL